MIRVVLFIDLKLVIESSLQADSEPIIGDRIT